MCAHIAAKVPTDVKNRGYLDAYSLLDPDIKSKVGGGFSRIGSVYTTSKDRQKRKEGMEGVKLGSHQPGSPTTTTTGFALLGFAFQGVLVVYSFLFLWVLPRRLGHPHSVGGVVGDDDIPPLQLASLSWQPSCPRCPDVV